MSDRELRDLLEKTQGELERARARLEVLEAESTEALQHRIAELEESAQMMHARLEQGDAVRETWANRQAALERDLSIALARPRAGHADRRLTIPEALSLGGILAALGALLGWAFS